MTVEVNLTNADARQLSKQIRKVNVGSLEWLADYIDGELSKQAPAAPWRKVNRWDHLSFNKTGARLFLECGHEKLYHGYEAGRKARFSKRARCEECESN